MLLQEYKTIHKQPEFMCYKCNYEKKNQVLLHKHKKIHCQIYLLKCEMYNYTNNERKQVKQYQNMRKQMLVFKCFICKNLIWHQIGSETQYE